MPLVKLFHSPELEKEKGERALSLLETNMNMFLLDPIVKEIISVGAPVAHYRKSEQGTYLVSYSAVILYHRAAERKK